MKKDLRSEQPKEEMVKVSTMQTIQMRFAKAIEEIMEPLYRPDVEVPKSVAEKYIKTNSCKGRSEDYG